MGHQLLARHQQLEPRWLLLPFFLKKKKKRICRSHAKTFMSCSQLDVKQRLGDDRRSKEVMWGVFLDPCNKRHGFRIQSASSTVDVTGNSIDFLNIRPRRVV